MSHFSEVDIIEIKGTGTEFSSELSRHLSKMASYVLLDESGKLLSSEEFAKLLDSSVHWNFVIGGAYGVPEQIKQKAQMLLSLSPMTMPHEMIRIVFLEQLYRAISILNKTGYHH